MRISYWSSDVYSSDLAGMTNLFKSVRHPMDILEEVSAAEREVLVRTLVAGLRELSPMWSNSEAFRTIIIDLGHPPIMHGRSEDRLFGNECVSPCRARWSPYH